MLYCTKTYIVGNMHTCACDELDNMRAGVITFVVENKEWSEMWAPVVLVFVNVDAAVQLLWVTLVVKMKA